MYQIGMLCKHFKGETLLEKNIYKIESIGVSGKDIDESKVTYTGDGNLSTAKNLVIYSNIFQENKFFAREYEDISSELSLEKKKQYNQEIKVEPLSQSEIEIINNIDFIQEKKKLVLSKFK